MFATSLVFFLFWLDNTFIKFHYLQDRRADCAKARRWAVRNKHQSTSMTKTMTTTTSEKYCCSNIDWQRRKLTSDQQLQRLHFRVFLFHSFFSLNLKLSSLSSLSLSSSLSSSSSVQPCLSLPTRPLSDLRPLSYPLLRRYYYRRPCLRNIPISRTSQSLSSQKLDEIRARVVLNLASSIRSSRRNEDHGLFHDPSVSLTLSTDMK